MNDSNPDKLIKENIDEDNTDNYNTNSESETAIGIINQKASVEKGNENYNQKEKNTEVLWDEIGFHKPIAGFWYNIIYTILGIFISAIFAGYLLSFFYPWPESFGYKDIVFSYFNLLWLLFDTGTRAVMSRYIPETNIKDPQKMMKYIQYFIWYQMITGLLQTTIVSIYALFFASKTTMAYTVWIMLVASTTQYPGFLHVFRSVLESLQQYDKAQTLNFLTSTIVQRITEMGFVYLGRLWGEANPQFGPIMGIAIGASIGLYVDDFVAMIVSAVFFDKVMRKYGISSKECFHIYFRWSDIKPVIIFSIKIASPEILGAGLGFINLMLWLTYLPQYTTLLIMGYIGGSIADIMNWFGVVSIDAPVAEAYMNGKKALSQYYLGQVIRFNFLMIGFFAPMIAVISKVMPIVWVEFGMINYVAGSFFIIPRLVRLSFERILWAPGSVVVGADRPNFRMTIGIIGSISTTLSNFLFLAVLKLPEFIGIEGIAWLMEIGWLPVGLITGGITYAYVHKKIFPVVIPVKQILLGIVVPSVITYLALNAAAMTTFFPLYANNGIFAAILATIPFMFVVLFFVYFPLTSILGGWDKINLEEFRKSAWMSGPSKFLVWPLYLLVEFFSRKSKLHDKFGMESVQVLKEAQELFEIKVKNREKFKEMDVMD